MNDLHRGTGKSFEISPRTSVAYVKLRVNDIQRFLDFYEQLLGFELIGKVSEENAYLSASGNGSEKYLIHLSKVVNEHTINKLERLAKRTGLFHFAILLPSRRYLANVFRHLTENSINYISKVRPNNLDLDQLYQEADNFGSWRMPENTVIGHVHLHVSNLSESKKFYSEILGLHHTCTFPRAYFFAATCTITMWQPIHGLALIYRRLILKN